ncbi:MAG TPA: spore coat protein CotH [Clostridiales bacterium]|nr:spore coat protein CotH [Clostridiales bacterium]
MIGSKKINIIIAISLAFALVITTILISVGNMQKTSTTNKNEAEYATKIFGSEIISIEIIADEKEWQQMLDNAINEEFIMADVIVNGTKFQSVGIRPKGNSSLTQVVNSDSDRYSFRLQFDEYIKGQTCFGLESFVVNNMLGDNTYMKEYISYDLMQEIGVDAPYFGFADIKVNDENVGLYLAVELYNESYEQRVFNDISGMLYNVKSMDMGGNNGENKSPQQGGNGASISDEQNGRTQKQNDAFQQGAESQQFPENMPNAQPPLNSVDSGHTESSPPENTNMPSETMQGRDKNMEGGFGRGGGRGSSGGSLEYTDDEIESYSSIFSNVVGKGTNNDFKRVIQALKMLSEGNELDKYFDVDKILRYLAAHTIVVNLDSYSSSMAQNYYIYEKNGKITILPWDYNLAWGGFQSKDASSVINFPIDTPLSGVNMSSRPLIEKLFANEEYLEKYHNYLQQLVNEYFSDGKFEEKVNSLDALISSYVQNDKTAFCTYDEYKKAVSSFITLGNLRAQSVRGQIDGTVPSTAETQNTNGANLISAGDFNLSDLGSMMGGKGGNIGDIPNEMGGQNPGQFPGNMSNALDMDLIAKAMDIIQQANGEITESVKEDLIELGLTEEQIEQISIMGNKQSEDMRQGNRDNMPFNDGGMNRQGDVSSSKSENRYNEQNLKTSDIVSFGALLLGLAVALIFVKKYKKNY